MKSESAALEKIVVQNTMKKSRCVKVLEMDVESNAILQERLSH